MTKTKLILVRDDHVLFVEDAILTEHTNTIDDTGHRRTEMTFVFENKKSRQIKRKDI